MASKEVITEREYFPTERRVNRREIIEAECPPEEELERWAKEMGVKIGPRVPEGYRYKVLCGLWTWRDLNSVDLNNLPPTDLIRHRVCLKEGTIPYAVKKGRRLSLYQEHFLAKIVREGLACGMYERTPVDEPLSRWSAPPVLVTKDPNTNLPTNTEDFDEGPILRLTFNYSNVHEDLPAVDHVLQTSIIDMLSNPKFKVMSKGDLKHGYWVVAVEKEFRPILAFNIPGIGQLRPTRMPQGCRSSSATFQELGRIAFGAIPEPHPEPSLIGETFRIFVDDMFAGNEDEIDHFNFIFDEWFPRIAWAMLRFAFPKLWLFWDELEGIGQTFRVGGEMKILPERVDKIIRWPSPTDRTGVRSFMGAVQICRRWIKNFTEIARPLTRLQGVNTEWTWGLVEETSFRILKNKCATMISVYGFSWNLPARCYFDASQFAAGFALTQLIGNSERPVIYDSVAFNPTQKKYGTYKRELLSIVHFAEKYHHYLTSNHTATFFTDHLPLVTFINSDNHSGIYARWALKLQELNFEFVHIEGRRNTIADGLSRTIFPGDVPSIEADFGRIVEIKDAEGDREWFWKDGKGGYEELLKKRKDEQTMKEPETSVKLKSCSPMSHPKIIEGSDMEKRYQGKSVIQVPGDVSVSRFPISIVEDSTKTEELEFPLLTNNDSTKTGRVEFPLSVDKSSIKTEKLEFPLSQGGMIRTKIEMIEPRRGQMKKGGKMDICAKSCSHLSKRACYVSCSNCEEGKGFVKGKKDERERRKGEIWKEREKNQHDDEEMVPDNLDFVIPFSRMTTISQDTSNGQNKWLSDQWYKDIFTYLVRGGKTPEGLDTTQRTVFKQNANKFRMIGDNLYHYDRIKSHLIPCIPENEVRRILEEAHDHCGHYASSQVSKKLQNTAWWPDRNTDIKTYIDGCLSCAKYGPAIRSHSLQPTITFKPFDMIGIDFIGPLEKTTNGNSYILHAIDYFSRYSKTWACKTDKPEDVMNCLSAYFDQYPLPIVVYSDRGTHFDCFQTRSFLELHEVVHILSPSGSSKSTGMIERANQELEKALRRMADKNMSSWDLYLGRATRAINTRVVVALGYTPFELLFGIQPRLPFEFDFPDEEMLELRAWSSTIREDGDMEINEDEMNEMRLDRGMQIKEMRDEMIRRWEERNIAMKERYDKAVKGWKYAVGDLVMLYDNTVGTKAKSSHKLAIQWPGPYLVDGFAGDHGTSYKLRHIHGKKIPGTHHGDHLKLFRPRTGRLSQPFDENPAIGPRSIRHLRRRAMKIHNVKSRLTSLVQTSTAPNQDYHIDSHPPHISVTNNLLRKGFFHEEKQGIKGIHAHWAKGFWRMVGGE